MVAGFVIVNFTRAGEGFHDSVHDLSGPIYLFFFTYTGVCMDLGVLTRNVPACILMFSTRTLCIFVQCEQAHRVSHRLGRASRSAGGLTESGHTRAYVHVASGGLQRSSRSELFSRGGEALRTIRDLLGVGHHVEK